VEAKRAEIELSEQAKVISSTKKGRADEEETAAKEAVEQRKLCVDQMRDALNQDLKLLETEQQALVLAHAEAQRVAAEEIRTLEALNCQKVLLAKMKADSRHHEQMADLKHRYKSSRPSMI